MTCLKTFLSLFSKDYAGTNIFVIIIDLSKVQSVEGCTVHYQDTLLATVNANIKLKTPSITIEKAEDVASELKNLLENNDNIHSAGIFLDLNTSPALQFKSNVLAP